MMPAAAGAASVAAADEAGSAGWSDVEGDASAAGAEGDLGFDEDEDEEEEIGPRALPVDGEPDFDAVRRGCGDVLCRLALLLSTRRRRLMPRARLPPASSAAPLRTAAATLRS